MTTTTPELYGTKDYKRSRKAYCIECAFEYFVSLMVTDSFLAMLLRNIGVSESMIVIVSSLISLAFLFQFFAIFAVQKITNTKRFAIIFHFASQLVFMSLYLIPFLGFAKEAKAVLVIGGILLAYFGNYFVNSVIYRWGNSHVQPSRLGRYCATKEMISLISGMIVTIVIGYIMGIFTNQETQTLRSGGLIFAAIAILVFALSDLVCLLLIKNQIKPKEEVKESVPMKEVWKNTMGNKSFSNVVILYVIYTLGIYTTVGSIGAYKLDLLKGVDAVKALFWIQIINNVGVFSRFAFSRPFGKYSDKNSYAKGISLALIVAAIGYAVNIFTSPSTWYLIIVFTMLYSIHHAGASANFTNVTFSYVDKKYFVEASAIKNSIAGICGFGASILASMLVKAMEGGKEIFGVTVYAPQILSAISFVLFITAFLFNKLVIEKQKRIEFQV